MIFANFHRGALTGWKSRKTKFYVFCLFTPLYRRFRLSRVSHAQDLYEIYRLVSKILNFTPCGSVFGRFYVLYGFLLFAGAAGHNRQIPTYVVRLNSYYSSAAVARTVAKWVALYRHPLISLLLLLLQTVALQLNWRSAVLQQINNTKKQ